MTSHKNKPTAKLQGQKMPVSQDVDLQRPLASSLLQEFQNLKDKFKNEDDGDDKGSPYQYLEKATVLQECRVFHDASVVTQNPRRCCLLITKLLFLLVKGESLTSAEVTEVFFGVTKLFQSDDVNLRRMMYLFIKEVAETCNPDDIIIVVASLVKDMNSGEDLYRANAMRVLAKIIDPAMLGAIERYLKQAIVDRNAFVASSALMSGLRLFKNCPEVVRRWINEVQEAVASVNDMVQYHALSLLYKIKQHDRLAVSKTVQQLSKGSLRSPLATCLLIRYTCNLMREDMAAATVKSSFQFLENCLRHKSDMVIYEAARSICGLPGAAADDLSSAVPVLHLFLSSPKSSLRFAAMRTLSEVASRFPALLAKCNDDMETLVSDSNRSIATLAITTLLKTGNETSIDRLMRKISTFMTEIGDEFKVVVVNAVRELCAKYPQKNKVLVGYLASFLREEGGFVFKKCIVDSILDLMSLIPDTKETCLLYLCEFIEDCEFVELIVQVMSVIGKIGPTTVAPSRYIRFVFNRVILENARIRAAAVSTLGLFASRVPDLRDPICSLLKMSLADEDDEVRDRAATLLETFESNKDDSAVRFMLDEPMPISFSALERSVRAYISHGVGADIHPLTFSSLPVIEEAFVAPSTSSKSIQKKLQQSDAASAEALDPAVELYKIPAISQLGRVFRSCIESQLTESEMEYVVSCIKHVFTDHIVLQFNVLNTVDDQRLQDVNVLVGLSDDECYVVESYIPAKVVRYGETEQCYAILRRVGGINSVSMTCEMHFKLVQVDPTSGEIEGDVNGYDEEYPLEDLEVNVCDFMAKVSLGDFRRSWEQLGNDGEVLEKYALQFKKLGDAVGAVIDFLGMQPCDGTEVISPSTDKRAHTLHMTGVFLGNVPVLVRAQLQLDDTSGVILKLAVRSANSSISKLVSEMIN